MNRMNYEQFKEEVLDAIHDYMSFHDEPPTRQIVIEDAAALTTGGRYKWLDRMRHERLIKYVENPRGGMFVHIHEESK